MDKFDWNIEMDNHLKYYMALNKAQDTYGEEIEERTTDIIKKKESDSNLDIEDFYFLEQRSFENSIIQTDIIKTVSRIRLLYQLSKGYGIEFSLPEPMNNILNKLINADSFDFVYTISAAGLDFNDPDMEEKVRTMCVSSIDPASLEKRYEMLKAQYEFFINNIKNGNQESDSK